MFDHSERVCVDCAWWIKYSASRNGDWLLFNQISAILCCRLKGTNGVGLWKSSDQYLSFIHGLTRLVKKEKHQWINYTKKVVLCLAFLMGLYSQINYNGFYMGYSGRMILDLQLPITTNVVSSNTARSCEVYSILFENVCRWFAAGR